MKKVLLLTVFLMACCFGPQAFAQQTQGIDSGEAKYIAEQLMDSSVAYGIFESAPLDGRLKALKSGVTPELEDGYLEVMIKNMLCKLNTVTAFKGDFDSIIYITTPTAESDAELPIQFYPYPSSKWFLIFRSPFDQFGQPKPEWIIHLNKPKVKSYLNPLTIFENVSIYQGNVCLHWDKTYQEPYGLKVLSKGFEEDIAQIAKVLNSAAKGSPERAGKLHALESGLRTGIAKAIAANLK